MDDGSVEYKDLDEVGQIMYSQVAALARAHAEVRQREEEAQHSRLADIGAEGRKTMQERAQAKRDAIIADNKRFQIAFRSYERIDLGPLLAEFGIDKAKRATFGPRNIAAALALKHDLTPTQIRAILRNAKKQTKAR